MSWREDPLQYIWNHLSLKKFIPFAPIHWVINQGMTSAGLTVILGIIALATLRMVSRPVVLAGGQVPAPETSHGMDSSHAATH